MSIIFESIRYKNFISTGNEFTEIQLNKHNSTLIIGENGSGKSTLLDAIMFAMFGKPFRNINKPQLLNSITKKDMVVELRFSIGSNKYKIIRGIKPNIFEVYQNDSLLNQSAESKDYQEILEKQIFKANFKSCCQVLMLGSATFQPFMQLEKGKRREIIEDLLDLQIFTSMNALLKNKIMLNGHATNDCNSNKKLIEAKIKLIQEHKSEIDNNNAQYILDKTNKIKDYEEEIKEINLILDRLDIQINDLEKTSCSVDNLRNKLNSLDSLNYKISANLSIIENDIKFLKNNDTCPTCKQEIEEKFKGDNIETKEKEKKNIEEGLEKLNQKHKTISDKLNNGLQIIKEINNLKLEQHMHRNAIKNLIKNIDDLNKDIKQLSYSKKNESNDKISDLEKELEKNKEIGIALIQEKNTLMAASLLLKDSGIKAQIIKQYVPIINKLINKYLAALDFFVQFELNEEFTETIKSRYRDDFSYNSFSEGEKMKINLAILFTWRAVAKLRNSINTNLLIMDEVFDSSLDSNGTDEFLKLLNSLTLDTNTFIISHKKDQLIEKFNNVIKFSKVKNFSRIE